MWGLRHKGEQSGAKHGYKTRMDKWGQISKQEPFWCRPWTVRALSPAVAGQCPQEQVPTVIGRCWKCREVSRCPESQVHSNAFCSHVPREHCGDLRDNCNGDCRGEWCCSVGRGFWRTGKFLQWLVVVCHVCSWLTHKFMWRLSVIWLLGAHQVKDSKGCSGVVRDDAQLVRAP